MQMIRAMLREWLRPNWVPLRKSGSQRARHTAMTLSVGLAAVGLVLVTGTGVSADLHTTSAAPSVAQQVDTPPFGPVGFTATTLLQTSTTVEGQPIHFPNGDEQFTAILGEIAPGGQAGRHMHPVPLLVYMLEGSLSIEMEGHGTHVVNAGEAFTEVINTWHNGRNLGNTPARFLIVFAGQDGTPITIRP
jgi:quercetin dioxygenase-like cupin family protein